MFFFLFFCVTFSLYEPNLLPSSSSLGQLFAERRFYHQTRPIIWNIDEGKRTIHYISRKLIQKIFCAIKMKKSGRTHCLTFNQTKILKQLFYQYLLERKLKFQLIMMSNIVLYRLCLQTNKLYGLVRIWLIHTCISRVNEISGLYSLHA